MKKDKLTAFWWLWLPLALLGVQSVIEIIVPGKAYARLMSEGGPHELAEFFLLLMSFFVALRIFFIPVVRKTPWLAAWTGLAALGCFYVGGEEISWGQHVWGWQTPETWRTINDQQETNFHNISAWFDQKPRIFLEAGVITGGLIIPFLRDIRKMKIPSWLALIAPPSWLAVTAGLFLFVKLADAAEDITGLVPFKRASEVEELYLFYFVLLYLADFRRRLRSLQGAGGGAFRAELEDGLK